MYMCIAHSGREVGGSEARMIIPADQTESREERSEVEEFYVTQERNPKRNWMSFDGLSSIREKFATLTYKR